MSTELYHTWWINSLKQLAHLKEYDARVQKDAKNTAERPEANLFVGDLFARYTMAVEALSACLDQACTVQKRPFMRKLVESAVMRLQELRNDLCKINLSEYHYIDGNLIELKLIPHSIEVLSPGLYFNREYFVEDMWKEIQKGERIYTAPPEPDPITLYGEYGEEGEEEEEEEAEEEEETTMRRKKITHHKKESVVVFKPPVVILTPEEIEALRLKEILNEAATLIQSHERCRQDRIYHYELELRVILKKKAESKALSPEYPIEDQQNAALTIQRTFRGRRVRQFNKKREAERRLLIGMTEGPNRSYEEKEKFRANLEKRRELQHLRIREYIDENLNQRARLLRVMAPGLMEDVGDEIRSWFLQFYVEAKCFDKYPTEEQGGSILIVRGETMTPKEFIDDAEKKRKEKSKGKDKKALKAAEKKKKAEEKKREADKKKKEKEKQKKAAQEEKKREAKGMFDYKMEVSPYNATYKSALTEYKEFTAERPFEENKEEKLYADIILDEKCHEIQIEIRPFVDDLMRIELEVLMAALAKDKGKKYKKKKPKKKKKKKKKGKKKKDMTSKRTTEDLFQELVDNGIIRTYPRASLDEFKGDFSYKNNELRDLMLDPPATLGDVRKAVAANCILPLGVETMVRPKSVLIVGHRQSGKHILANAVFNETRCVLFDISPPILAGKYQGKKEMKLLIHLINKMSRLLQPSIIYVDGGEKPFYKSVPKEEKEFEPKKMGSSLPKKIVKAILPEDRVLVLAITNKPFAANKKLIKTFERVILIPRTEYNSLYMYWRELLMSYNGVDRDFNCSELAKLTQNYTLPAIKAAVDKVLAPKRRIQLSFNPLNAHELLTALLEGEPPVEDKEWKKFEKWFKKTALNKKRVKLMKILAKQREKNKPKKR